MITRALLLNVCNVYVSFEPLGPRRIISFDNDPHPHPGRPQSPAEYTCIGSIDREIARARVAIFLLAELSTLLCEQNMWSKTLNHKTHTKSQLSQSHARGPASERAHTLGLRELGCVCGRRLWDGTLNG